MIEGKVRRLLARLEEVETLLGQPDVVSDPKRFKPLGQEHAQLTQLKDVWDKLQRAEKELAENKVLLDDPSLGDLARDEVTRLEAEVPKLRAEVELLVVPPDPRDSRSIIVEIRAGTGGEEAALFVADMARMYRNYAISKKWKMEVLSSSESDMGGYKDYIFSLAGPNVHRLMQYEAGTHRVQRVPETETQGRVHTSAVTVAVLLEPEEGEKVHIEEKDLRIDTYRSSGAGGQHVNTTDSAVRITHIPTGVVVACQEERSQHKNREKAMRYLASRIAEEQRRKAHEEMSAVRSSQVGSGDRSERIRTYNFPQNRLTDHRINLTLYQLDRIMEGDVDPIATALVSYFYEQRLNA